MYIGKPNPYFHIYLFPYCQHLLTRNWTLDLTLELKNSKRQVDTTEAKMSVMRECGIHQSIHHQTSKLLWKLR